MISLKGKTIYFERKATGHTHTYPNVKFVGTQEHTKNMLFKSDTCNFFLFQKEYQDLVHKGFCSTDQDFIVVLQN